MAQPRHGLLHSYLGASSTLNLFEFIPPHPSATTSGNSNHAVPPNPYKNILLFVGGMYDNFSNPHYPTDLAALFPPSPSQTWRVMHIQLTSAGRTFGITPLDRDIDEISSCVTYIRSLGATNIVLMGHSTGCQDTMRYLTAPNPVAERKQIRRAVQGAILQAPVSDRDAVLQVCEESEQGKKAYDKANEICRNTPREKWKDTVLGLDVGKAIGLGPVAMTLERWWSVASPESPENPSDEDFFSNDLSEETNRRRFGQIGAGGLLVPVGGKKPELLVLISGSDEAMGEQIDKEALLGKWRDATAHEGMGKISDHAGVVLNGTHGLDGDDWPSQEARLVNMRERVLRYLVDVVGEVDESAWAIWQEDKKRVLSLKKADGRNMDEAVGVLKL